ncbi:MAG: hypothetical protein ACPGQV_20270 [Alphaproteobacteria bacterium]|jgi:hypothetical protein
MDISIQYMLEDSYMETVEEALGAGHNEDTAHNEGVTAAAMEGLEGTLARAEVDTMSCHPGMLYDT